MPGTRIVAFLGGDVDYDPRLYALVERNIRTQRSSPTLQEIWIKLAAALNGEGLGMSATSLVIIGTSQTRKKFLDTGELQQEISKSCRESSALPIAFCECDLEPFGQADVQQGEEGFWKIFESLRVALSPKPLVESSTLKFICGRDDVAKCDVDHIVLDITHGFRALPFLASAALSFVLTEMRGESRVVGSASNESGARVLTQYHVLYAALESVGDDPEVPVPVWDLTRFVLAVRLAAAIDALVCYGRADDLCDLGRNDARSRIAPVPVSERSSEMLEPLKLLEAFSLRAKALADDMATIRLQSIFRDSAPAMKKFIEENSPSLLKLFPPLESTINILANWVAPLVAADTVGKAGVRATAHLAAIYGSLERFAEQATAMREGLISYFGILANPGIAPTEPGHSAIKGERERIGRNWAVWARKGRSEGHFDSEATDEKKRIFRISSGISQPRNDIDHGGLNAKPLKAKDLRKALAKLAADFVAVVDKQ